MYSIEVTAIRRLPSINIHLFIDDDLGGNCSHRVPMLRSHFHLTHLWKDVCLFSANGELP